MSRQGKRNKERGYEFEKEIEAKGRDFGFDTACRTWGSDGRSRSLHKNVDVTLCDGPDQPDIHLQCKRQKRKVSKRYIPDENIHAQIIRGDYQDPYAVLEVDKYFRMLQLLRQHELLDKL